MPKANFNKLFFSAILVSGFFICQVAFASSQIYISQVQITSGKDNLNQDFVELFNPNSEAFNLKGYRLVKWPAESKSDTAIKVF